MWIDEERKGGERVLTAEWGSKVLISESKIILEDYRIVLNLKSLYIHGMKCRN